MSKRSISVLIAGLAMIFGVTGAFADNSLDVDASAAISGNYGLEVLVDGSANGTYVTDATANDETVYRVEFRIRHNSLNMADLDSHAVLLGRKGMPSQNNIRIIMARLGGGYKILGRAKKDGQGSAKCGKFTMGVLGSRVGFEWVASDGSNNGLCRLYKNGTLQGEKLNIDNETLEVDNVRFGAPQGVDPGTTGPSYYLDDFSSFSAPWPRSSQAVLDLTGRQVWLPAGRTRLDGVCDEGRRAQGSGGRPRP